MSNKRVASSMSSDIKDGAPNKKRREYQQQFPVEYTKEWPFIVHSKIDNVHSFCTLSVKCGGRDDLNKHVETKLHRPFRRRRR